MAVCKACKGKPHSGKPDKCRGGTWCDCQHRMNATDVVTGNNEDKMESNDD